MFTTANLYAIWAIGPQAAQLNYLLPILETNIFENSILFSLLACKSWNQPRFCSYEKTRIFSVNGIFTKKLTFLKTKIFEILRRGRFLTFDFSIGSICGFEIWSRNGKHNNGQIKTRKTSWWYCQQNVCCFHWNFISAADLFQCSG